MMVLQPDDLKEQVEAYFKAQVDAVEQKIDKHLKGYWRGGDISVRCECWETNKDIVAELQKRYHGWHVKAVCNDDGDYNSYWIELKPRAR